MAGHSYLNVLGNGKTYSKLKALMYPDGGFSRLGLFESLPEIEKAHFKSLSNASPISFDEKIPATKKPLTISYQPSKEEIKQNWERFKKGEEVNVASLGLGARLLKATNEHYGPAIQVLSPFPAINMFDGLESARSRLPGHSEEVIVELAKPSLIHRIEMDFTYFVNNNPMFVSVEGKIGGEWKEIINRTKVKAFAGNAKGFQINSSENISELRVVTYPDGGMNRLRVFTKL
jgi:allantoicase